MVRASLIICSVLFLLYTEIVFTQELDSVYNKKCTVYWFNIEPKIVIQKKTRKPKYIISLKNKKIDYGSLKSYEKNLFKSTYKGKYIPIGPFNKLKDAKFAIKHYELKHHTDSSMVKELRNINDSISSNNYFWFYYNVPTKRRTPYKRIPARIAESSIKEFKTILWEALYFRKLAIGPFTTKLEAERAKRLYRLEE